VGNLYWAACKAKELTSPSVQAYRAKSRFISNQSCWCG
jgi:hypothetical protein